MSDTIGNRALGTGHLTQLRRKIRLIVLAIVWAAAATCNVNARESKDWIVLKNCQLISNPANDGDSFHARSGAMRIHFSPVHG